MMPLVGFLPAKDPRVVSTVEAIQSELMSDGLVKRYLDREPRSMACRRAKASFCPARSGWSIASR